MGVTAFPIIEAAAGVAYIEDTSTKVIEVVQAKQGHDFTPEEVQRQLPHLTLAQVYADLAYYHANKEELDAQIAERHHLADELRAQNPNPFTREDLLARREGVA
jgi:uncharacterized protein (DUF433 family)